jgi:hypothetical protein
MKSKSIFAALALFISLRTSTGQAAPAWFAKLELEITGVMPVGFSQEGLRADVSFDGSAGGPHIADGTVVGVDHAVFDSSRNAHLNVYLTITDKDQDQISANITGLARFSNPGQYLLEGASGIIINERDPNTGAFHATNGKFAHMIDGVFADAGKITAFTFNPAAGSVHAKWYLREDFMWRGNDGTAPTGSGNAANIPEPPAIAHALPAILGAVFIAARQAGRPICLSPH